MPTMRTIPNAVKEYKEKDPYTPVTATALRRWVKDGLVASVKVGRTILCNMESLDLFLSGGGVVHEDR